MPEPETIKSPSVLDRAIEFFAPAWGCNRFMARMQMDSIRRYDAASNSVRLKGWFTPNTGPDGITRSSKERLRNRTRDLERNNAWYRRAIDISVNNVIGSGIKLQILTSEKSNKRRDKLQSSYNDTCLDSNALDYDGLHDFYALCRLIYRTRIVSGECLIRKSVSRKNGLQLQVLEPDFLDDTKDGIETDNGGYISQGIEFDKNGKRVAYWLFESHPSDYLRFLKFKSVRVPADQIIHYFKAERPGQIRGVPKGVQIILRLHDLDLFQDAELKKNQIAALLVAFRRKPSTPKKPGDDDKPRNVQMFPGTVEDLPPGEDMTFTNPPQHQMYPEYVRTILMEIAAAFGLTYEMLSGDLKKTNFSSGRMGWIVSSRHFNSEQKDFISGVLNPVFNWWLEIEALSSGIDITGVKAKWFTPHREMIDPPKEIKAFAEAKNENILPLQFIWQGLGYDEDEVIAAIAETQQKMEAAGITSADKKDISQTQIEKEDEDEDADDEDQ